MHIYAHRLVFWHFISFFLKGEMDKREVVRQNVVRQKGSRGGMI